MRHLECILLGALLAAAPSVFASTEITLDSLLQEMIDRDAIARLPEPAYVCRQASSHDRSQTDPADARTWHGNNDYDQFIRVETNGLRREWVIMEHEGPGCIVRFWTPLFARLRKATIRFYFDGQSEPGIEANFNELLSGRSFARPPFAFVASDEHAVEGVGGDLYLPIPFARSCRITLDEQPFYYVINYRAYGPGVAVRTFATSELASSSARLERTARELIAPGAKSNAQSLRREGVINPGEELSIDLPSGEEGVSRLEVQVDPADAPQVLRSAVVEGTFDGQLTIWCPLGEFFGCGARLRPVGDWCRQVDSNGVMAAFWTMPYRRSGRLAIRNQGTKPLALKLAADTRPWKWDDRSMYFHAGWRQQYPIPTRPMSDWNYVELSGQGVYVGDTLTVLNPSSKWYGEGDEFIYVDGEKLPSHMGTGTEDYYGYAWGMAYEFRSPFISMPRRDVWCDRWKAADWSGYTTTSRMRLLDGIPWGRSLKVDMEIWHAGETAEGYAVGAFWYARPGASSNRGAQPEDAARLLPEMPPKFRLPGAIECETAAVAEKAPGLPAAPQTFVFKQGEWSGGQQLFVQGRHTGDFVMLRLPAPKATSQRLMLHATRSWDYGILRFTVNGQAAGPDFDAWAAEPVLSGPIELGTFTPVDGAFLLRAEVVGANPAAKGSKSFFGLDAVTLDAAPAGESGPRAP